MDLLREGFFGDLELTGTKKNASLTGKYFWKSCTLKNTSAIFIFFCFSLTFYAHGSKNKLN